jgi:hypothetical protein
VTLLSPQRFSQQLSQQPHVVAQRLWQFVGNR